MRLIRQPALVLRMQSGTQHVALRGTAFVAHFPPLGAAAYCRGVCLAFLKLTLTRALREGEVHPHQDQTTSFVPSCPLS